MIDAIQFHVEYPRNQGYRSIMECKGEGSILLINAKEHIATRHEKYPSNEICKIINQVPVEQIHIRDLPNARVIFLSKNLSDYVVVISLDK